MAMCDEARALLAGLGAVDLTNLTAASVYADTADSEARHARQAGRLDDADRLEREVYDIAEKVLARRPGDLRSMKNRALAANLLGEIASTRHDDAAAAQYAERAALAGEDVVRFNPSDLGTWQYWIMGRGQVAERLFERGEIGAAIDAAHATLALGDDERLPSTLQPQLEDTWFRLAWLEAASGRSADAERAFARGVQAAEESAKQFAEGNSMRVLTLARVPVRRARFELVLGEAQGAFDRATAAVAYLEKLAIDPKDSFGKRVHDNVLQLALGVVSDSALRLEHYADAEAAARKRLALPLNPFDNPVADKANRQVKLALALAYQGRGDEARTVVAPALEYYTGEKKAGAKDTYFRLAYAEALLASALAQPPDAAGRAARLRALAEANDELAGASAEARQLSTTRVLSSDIDAARAASGS